MTEWKKVGAVDDSRQTTGLEALLKRWSLFFYGVSYFLTCVHLLCPSLRTKDRGGGGEER